MKLRYKGPYKGTIPWLGRNVTPGEEIEVSDDVGEKLLKTQQFERISALISTLVEKKKEPIESIESKGGE